MISTCNDMTCMMNAWMMMYNTGAEKAKSGTSNTAASQSANCLRRSLIKSSLRLPIIFLPGNLATRELLICPN